MSSSNENTTHRRKLSRGKKIAIGAGAVVVLAGVGGAIGAAEDGSTADTSLPPSVTVSETPTFEAPTNEAPTFESSEQANANESAKQYLSIMAFSREGLIGQLTFDGFPPKVAAKAVDNADPDWSEQAVKSAEQYLNIMTFSRSGLISQLTFDGFTQQQAQYAVDTVY